MEHEISQKSIGLDLFMKEAARQELSIVRISHSDTPQATRSTARRVSRECQSHVGCSRFSKQTPTSPTNLPGRLLCSVQVYSHGGVACAWTRPTVTAQRPRPQKRRGAAHVSTPEAQLHPTHTDTREFLGLLSSNSRTFWWNIKLT